MVDFHAQAPVEGIYGIVGFIVLTDHTRSWWRAAITFVGTLLDFNIWHDEQVCGLSTANTKLFLRNRERTSGSQAQIEQKQTKFTECKFLRLEDTGKKADDIHFSFYPRRTARPGSPEPLNSDGSTFVHASDRGVEPPKHQKFR